MLNHEILKEKLAVIGYDESNDHDKVIVEALLAIAVTLDSYPLSENQRGIVLDLISSEGQDKISNLPDLQEDSWEDFNYGNVGIGHFIRVKKDAYDSESGKAHNGLVGILTFMSGGRCRVNYIGLSAGRTMHHPKEKLESLKRGVK